LKVEILDQDVVWRDLEGEVVILNLATATYFGLEGVGNDIWRYLAEHRSTDNLVETLCGAYDVAPNELQRDLDRFIGELSEKGLIKVGEDSKTTP
jgi:hypothetical protein